MIAGPYTTAQLFAVLEEAPGALGVLVDVLAVLPPRPLAVIPLTLAVDLLEGEIERGTIHAVRQGGRWYLATVTPRVSWREPGIDGAENEPADVAPGIDGPGDPFEGFR